MSSAYRQLLDATIAHLEDLQAQGVRTVPIPTAALTALSHRPGSPTAPRASLATAARPAAPPAGTAPRPPAARPSAPGRAVEPESFGGTFGDEPSRATAPSAIVPARPPARPLPPKLEPGPRREAMEALRQRAMACQQCSHLASTRHSVVFGVGDPNARILFIGEAPGADEDRAGEPFVGAAGQLLTKIIGAMGLSRETVYIANILKCRPDMPGGAAGNRKPRPDEMATCSPWLQEQIDLIQPEVLVALGSTAVEGLIGGPVAITRLRGKWQEFRGIPLMPTYHPAYLLRNSVLAEKRRVWEDMLAVLERLQLPISAKQRAYFTQG